MCGHVAGMGTEEMQTGFRWENVEGRDNVEEIGSDWTVILKKILRE
jgi:hypothetical protein